jgi:hypothetical protein
MRKLTRRRFLARGGTRHLIRPAEVGAAEVRLVQICAKVRLAEERVPEISILIARVGQFR